MTDPLRFLLDQNFPEVGLVDPHAVDHSVRYEHIRVWRPELVADTPDWLIYFEAELADFTGLVTKDWRQSVQAEEAFALTHTKLTVVTWREPPDDPIVEWAMLTAYMPEIKRILAGRRMPPVILLPSPRLTDRDNTQRRDHALGLAARARGISTAQATREAQASIIDHLTQEGLRPELHELAERKSTRRAPGSRLAPPKRSRGRQVRPGPEQLRTE